MISHSGFCRKSGTPGIAIPSYHKGHMAQRISRRTVLRGLGAAVSLPLLEGMLPLSALAQSVTRAQRPNRMAFLFVPNGIVMEEWTPGLAAAANPGMRGNVAAILPQAGEIAEPLTELPSILKPLEALKSEVQVLSGLAQRNAFALGDGPGDHARSAAAWLTGVHPKKTSGADIKNGISVDQVYAQSKANGSRFGSLELGCERGGVSGDCDSGYSCAYSSSVSWRGEATPNAKEVNPKAVFERLFGSPDGSAEARFLRERYRKSILDFVLDDAAALRKSLGLRDQRKLDEYLESVREIERRVAAFQSQNPGSVAPNSHRPKGVPADYAEHIRLMGDMMVLAFQADLTRAATFMFANEGSNRSYRQVGVPDGHHDMSHHGRNAEKLEKKRLIDLFHVQQLAHVLGRMKEIKEADGTLLDNTMLVYGGGIGDGDRHNHDDLPILLAGRGAGTLRPGRHVRFPKGTPMNNLFLSMLDRMGVPVETLGDSTGKLKGLL
jgi:hypothetical protein